LGKNNTLSIHHFMHVRAPFFHTRVFAFCEIGGLGFDSTNKTTDDVANLLYNKS
jgi:hypothetical protein